MLRDNKLTKIPDVSIFKQLTVFDVSYNEITALHGLSKVSNTLKELYVSKNEVTKMEEINHFHELRILELGSNRLRVSSVISCTDFLCELVCVCTNMNSFMVSMCLHKFACSCWSII